MSTSLIPRPVVDVSHHNLVHNMKWAAAKKAGIVGVIAKAGQGSDWVDPAFFDHLHLAKEAGIPLLGAYLFLDDSDPSAQANHLIDIAAHFAGSLDRMLLALDLEANPVLSATETVAGAAEVSDEVFKRLGRRPVLYMGIYGPDGKGSGLPNATLNKSDLWLPLYGQHMRLPKGFAVAGGPSQMNGTVRLWQQTDGVANGGRPVPGLGRVDQSAAVWFKDFDALKAWWGT